MNIRTIASLLKGGKLLLLLRFKGLFTTFYRLCFLASMADSAMMVQLARGPVTIENILGGPAKDPAVRSGIEAWLGLGVRLGLVKKDGAGYWLRGFMAKRLAAPGNDAIRALVREVAGLHHLYITETPGKLEQGVIWDPLGPHSAYGDVIARSSRTLEPFLFELIGRVFPRAEPVRLLEVGCGHAGYIIHAAQRNASLRAVGLELDERVAATARSSIRARGLEDRVDIMVEDVRKLRDAASFDIITLYNNIYYFPVEERTGLLGHLLGLVKPGGRIVLTTGCMNGSIEFELVNLIHGSTRGWGRLPEKDEMLEQMRAAGFEQCSASEILPGNKYYAFVGHRPG
jgi:SAM-dependent methyltransferase